MNRTQVAVLAVLLGAAGALPACGPAAGPGACEPDAPVAARFAAYEGRYSMQSTCTDAHGLSDVETGTMDLWVEADGRMRMTIALGNDAAPEGWAELRDGPSNGQVRWVTVTGHFEPSVETWMGRALPEGTIAMNRLPPPDGSPDLPVEALFSFPGEDTLRLVLTTRAADGSFASAEDYLFVRTGSTERHWAPLAPLEPPSGSGGPVRRRDAAAAVGDSDADGLGDEVDRCPDDPEDRDGFEDLDGCNDLDNDRDRIPDVADLCPNEPERYNRFEDGDGCPDR